MYDKRQSVLEEDKINSDISKLRYHDLTSKIAADNHDNRLLILDRKHESD